MALYELLKETTPYLLHPNLWIRQATAGFVASTAKILDGVDVVVKLGTILTPFMKQPVIQMDNPALILANLDHPIPRCVLDGVIRTQFEILTEFLNMLEERQTARTMSKTNIQVLYSEMAPTIKPLFRRLASDGMVPAVEDKLLYMKDNLMKISKHRAMKVVSSSEENGVLDLSHLRISKRTVPLDKETVKISVGSEALPNLVAENETSDANAGWQANSEVLEAKNVARNLSSVKSEPALGMVEYARNVPI